MSAQLSVIISENLRDLSDRLGGIAEFCRKTGLNRQLMNKYLAGDILPSVETLDAIANATGFSVADLVQPSAENVRNLKNVSLSKLLTAVSVKPPPTFRYGYYLDFGPTSGTELSHIISLCSLKLVDGRIRYRRKMPVPIKYAGKQRFWTYDGEAVFTDGGLCIAYINSSWGDNMGFFKLRTSHLMPHDLFGLKLAITSIGSPSPAIYKCYFAYLGEKPDLRQAMRSCRVIDDLAGADEFTQKSIEMLIAQDPVGWG